LSRPRAIRPAQRPLDATVTVPGSKSIANRALVCAALAPGRSGLSGLPDGDDTLAMARGLAALGIGVDLDGDRASVLGSEGALRPGPGAVVDSALAGTTSRFLTAVAALSETPVVIDGGAPLRRRPMGALHEALRALGATVETLADPDHLPVRVARSDLRGGAVPLPGDVSSQYLTALMLIGPLLPQGLRIELTTELVSRPYVAITASVMAAFGAGGVHVGEREVVVPAGGYRAVDYLIEPDASSASYPFAAAAICGGKVHVPALAADSLQGDVRFVELLERMGCTATRTAMGTTVERDPGTPLRGVHVDMADISDLVPTLAVVAAFAATPTEITGVGFIRAKESNRIDDVVAELGRLGIAAEARPDGMRIEPGAATAAEVQTHHDHRLAMAFALAGLLVPGLSIGDPDVVTKSWPGYWSMLDAVVR
jgi:3-phosphoshikimate 1-carboxyvinyltransferase